MYEHHGEIMHGPPPTTGSPRSGRGRSGDASGYAKFRPLLADHDFRGGRPACDDEEDKEEETTQYVKTKEFGAKGPIQPVLCGFS